MKAQDIRTKLEKAQETVAKKEGTLAKYYAKKEKIAAKITANGLDIDGDKYQKYGTPEHEDCYWMFCDYDDVLERIESTKKAIAEKRGIVAKWQTALHEAEEKENLIESAFPEVLKDFQKAVVERWDEYDAKRKARLTKEYNEMRNKYGRDAYSEFVRKYNNTTYDFMAYTTKDEIHRDNVKASEQIMVNLWNRVKDITGEATDWSGLHLTNGNEYEGVAVNGIVTGKNGTARVETISAGGWNIQRFHYRTLVHEVK